MKGSLSETRRETTDRLMPAVRPVMRRSGESLSLDMNLQRARIIIRGSANALSIVDMTERSFLQRKESLLQKNGRDEMLLPKSRPCRTYTLRGSFAPRPGLEPGSFPIQYETSFPLDERGFEPMARIRTGIVAPECAVLPRWTTMVFHQGTGPPAGPAAREPPAALSRLYQPLMTATGDSSVTIFTRSA